MARVPEGSDQRFELTGGGQAVVARHHLSKGSHAWFTPQEPDRTVRRWGPILARSGRRCVLDIGCGGGRHTVYMARLGLEVTAGDLSPLALEQTRRWLERERVQAHLVQFDMISLPFPAESFDAVVSVNVLHHARPGEARRAVAEVWRVLRPGGLFLAVVAGPRDCYCLLERPPGATWPPCAQPQGSADARPCAENDLFGLFSSFSILGTQRRNLSLPGDAGPACWRGVNWRVLAERPGGGLTFRR